MRGQLVRSGRSSKTTAASTPHDRVAIPQICSARSLALDRPRQSALRFPAGVSNRPQVHRVRGDPPRIHQPLHRRTTCWIDPIPITHLTCGSQISIAPAAPPSVLLRAVSSLGGFRTPAAEHPAPSLMRPASEALHNNGHSAAQAKEPSCVWVDASISMMRRSL